MREHLASPCSDTQKAIPCLVLVLVIMAAVRYWDSPEEEGSG